MLNQQPPQHVAELPILQHAEQQQDADVKQPGNAKLLKEERLLREGKLQKRGKPQRNRPLPQQRLRGKQHENAERGGKEKRERYQLML